MIQLKKKICFCFFTIIVIWISLPNFVQFHKFYIIALVMVNEEINTEIVSLKRNIVQVSFFMYTIMTSTLSYIAKYFVTHFLLLLVIVMT